MGQNGRGAQISHKGAEARLSDFSRLKSILRPILDERARHTRDYAPEFSLLGWLGLARTESAHSAILKNLLDPRGTHGQGTRFIDSFIRYCHRLANFPITLDGKRLSSRRVYVDAEVGSALGRPDIRIVSHSPDFALIIENKIDQRDQESQLWRYWQLLRHEYRWMGRNIALVYLTPGGGGAHDPKAKLIPYARMSYRRHVSQWLSGRAVGVKPVSVRGFLEEYVAVAQKLTEASAEEEHEEA